MQDRVSDCGTSIDLSSFLSLAERFVVAVEAIAARKSETNSIRPIAREDMDDLACALLQDQDPRRINLSVIADRLDTNRRTLGRLPRFSEKLAEIKTWLEEVGPAPKKGHKGKDRIVESYVE